MLETLLKELNEVLKVKNTKIEMLEWENKALTRENAELRAKLTNKEKEVNRI